MLSLVLWRGKAKLKISEIVERDFVKVTLTCKMLCKNYPASVAIGHLVVKVEGDKLLWYP